MFKKRNTSKNIPTESNISTDTTEVVEIPEQANTTEVVNTSESIEQNTHFNRYRTAFDELLENASIMYEDTKGVRKEIAVKKLKEDLGVDLVKQVYMNPALNFDEKDAMLDKYINQYLEKHNLPKGKLVHQEITKEHFNVLRDTLKKGFENSYRTIEIHFFDEKLSFTLLNKDILLLSRTKRQVTLAAWYMILILLLGIQNTMVGVGICIGMCIVLMFTTMRLLYRACQIAIEIMERK